MTDALSSSFAKPAAQACMPVWWANGVILITSARGTWTETGQPAPALSHNPWHAARDQRIDQYHAQRDVARDSSSTGTSPTATIASEGRAASARRSSRANW